MKFLVLGCNGMAGHMITLYLKEKGHQVTGFARKASAFVDTFIGDATDPVAVKNAVGKNQYDSVINCIGVLNQFAENNKAAATYLNAYLPHYLAQLTENTDTQIIHMSTDCIFSGARGQYTETDIPDGTTFYDRTKALGELDDSKNITLRTSIVGPDINESGIGLLNWFLQQQGQLKGFTKAIWTGQTTLQLAKIMEAAAMERATGLYNMVPETSISKYELLRLFNKYFKNNALDIVPVDNMAADKSLKRTNWEFAVPVSDYAVMVAELAAWMKDHKQLYPHYTLD